MARWRKRRGFAVAGLVGASFFVAPGMSPAQPSLGRGPASSPSCATVKVTATPPVNAQNAPFETVKSKLTNCGSSAETVKLTQSMTGPFAVTRGFTRSWSVTLAPGQTATKVRRIPYSCCGSYDITDTVYSVSGHPLNRAHTSFTFA